MKNTIKILLAIISLVWIITTNPAHAISQSQIQEYQREICTGSEYNSDGLQNKWEGPIKIYMVSWRYMPQYAIDEVKKVVRELQELGVPVSLCQYASQGNAFLYYCSNAAYEKVEQGACGLTKENWGLGVMNTDGYGHITSATIFIDSVRVVKPQAVRHYIREEITQVMGFGCDSYKYPDSIFYQEYSEVTEYSALDREIIRSVYQ